MVFESVVDNEQDLVARLTSYEKLVNRNWRPVNSFWAGGAGEAERCDWVPLQNRLHNYHLISCYISNWWLTLSLDSVEGINETRRYKSFLSVKFWHPKPIRIVAIEHGDTLAPFDAQIIFILSVVRVKNYISTRWILEKMKGECLKFGNLRSVLYLEKGMNIGLRGSLTHQRIRPTLMISLAFGWNISVVVLKTVTIRMFHASIDWKIDLIMSS